MIRVSGPYEIVTVRDSTLKILKDAIETTIIIDRATRAPGLSKSHLVSIIDCYTLEDQPLTHTVTPQMDKNRVVLDEIVRHVTQYSMTKYVVHWYVDLSEEDTIEPAHHLRSRIIVHFW